MVAQTTWLMIKNFSRSLTKLPFPKNWKWGIHLSKEQKDCCHWKSFRPETHPWCFVCSWYWSKSLECWAIAWERFQSAIWGQVLFDQGWKWKRCGCSRSRWKAKALPWMCLRKNKLLFLKKIMSQLYDIRDWGIFIIMKCSKWRRINMQ